MSSDAVTLTLGGDEALVLFDWLARFNKRDDVPFADQAEQRALWDLEAQLERSLADLFDGDYKALLAAARDRVRDPDD